MGTSMRLTIVIFSIMCFISSAFGLCGVDDLVIGSVRSGRQIQGKPEWNVKVVNNCNCSQLNILVYCKGFQTTEPVDPSIFKTGGDICLVNGGLPLQPQGDVRFSYAWDPPFFFKPYSTDPLC